MENEVAGELAQPGPALETPGGLRVFETTIAGRRFSVEVGRMAKQANGAVLVRYGDTALLATATVSREPREGIDFFPLTVDFEERQYAIGRIPGNFFRREGRPTERAILAARLTDRPIRPLFPEGFRNDVQVILTVFSVDHDSSPEICGIIGASAALTISDIPFNGPIGAVEVGLVDGQFVLNPTQAQQEKSLMNLTVAGTREAVLMVEAGAREVPEETVLEAILFGHRHIVEIVDFLERIRAEVGKPKLEIPLYQVPEEIEVAVREYATGPLRQAVMNPHKLTREEKVQKVQDEVLAHFKEVYPEKEKEVDGVLRKILKEQVRQAIVEDNTRPDGRRPDEMRQVTCEVALLPRTHGSGLFTRGQTQVLSVATLGAVGDVQRLDNSLAEEEFKRFMHHYNFPPYSVGETRPLRGPGRREVGHGALAERALLPVLPPETEFPYTIRLVSEVLESNGSTSMASVCGSSLTLMDAGVPIKSAVAGVAMGLVKEGERMVVLTDIQGIEDALGDMDFKVAGTATGVTALQMDIKIGGVDREVLRRALEQARQGRLHILEIMNRTIDRPRPEISPYAPRIIIMEIDPEKIRYVIGPGGKTINKIIEDTKVGNERVEIDIEPDGRIYIAAVNLAAGEAARRMIENLTRDVEVGAIYTGRVVRITKFGAFVEILPGKEGLVHISQLAENRVGRVEDVVKVGDEIVVKVTEIDDLGRISLSRREALRAAHQGQIRERRRNQLS